jgi:hypothetical protein
MQIVRGFDARSKVSGQGQTLTGDEDTVKSLFMQLQVKVEPLKPGIVHVHI